jgi:hypothetical protein
MTFFKRGAEGRGAIGGFAYVVPFIPSESNLLIMKEYSEEKHYSLKSLYF